MVEINAINQWAQGIIVAVIIGAIVEMILPNKKNKKYIKTIIGLYILFIIIYPVINKFSNKKIDIKHFETNKYKNEYKQMNSAKLDVNKYIDIEYKEKLKEEIKKELNEKGYNAKNIKIETESKEENYGEILKINLEIDKEVSNKMNNINEIEKVDVNVSNTEGKKTNNEISNEDIENVKEILSQKYSIDKSKINI